MIQWLKQMYLPKIFSCFEKGYGLSTFFDDLKAGICVGVIALPLAMAFAIASGVSPERGLYTAIVAGFLISLFGGSRVQIGGPTGAYIVLVLTTVQKHGYEGLALATFLAGIFLIGFGLLRLGILIRFIPYPVTIGFTTGIATLIFIGQIKNFFGLSLGEINFTCLLVSTAALLMMVGVRSLSKKIPGPIIAVIAATSIQLFFQFPIETIGTTFGSLPHILQAPSFSFFSLSSIQKVLPDAIAIALLGGLESLLSAMIADEMTGFRHRSNAELVAQGIGNIGSSLFGGIPATGAIARTTANIQMGAKTPVAGMIHAMTLITLMLLFATQASAIPLGVLAAVLMLVAYNMSELNHFIAILRGPMHDRLVLLTTYFLTVCIDLTFAVQIGVAVAALFFLKNMTEKGFKINELESDENRLVLEMEGPFFFAVSDLLNKVLDDRDPLPRRILIKMPNVPLIDATGLKALNTFHQRCEQLGIQLSLTEIRKEILPTLQNESIRAVINADFIAART